MAILPSGLADLVADGEDLARFLTSSRQFSSQAVRAAAFFPDDGGTSVYRHGAAPREDLWQIGVDHAVGSRTLYGAAILKARDVRGALLDVKPIEPPPRHADIVGWVSSGIGPELVKAEQVKQALLLAQHSQLVRCEPARTQPSAAKPPGG